MNPILLALSSHPLLKPQRGSAKSAFTLVELLTVIAIIGILAVLLIPAVGKARELAQREKSRSNLRQIAVAYLAFSIEGNRTRTIPIFGSKAVTNIYDFGEILARESDLNDALLYFLDADPRAAAVELPRVIIRKNRSTGKVTKVDRWFGSPVAYEAAAGLSPNSPATTTPLIWTRGLQADGTWNPDASPWESGGGHIAFLDGHVEYHKTLEGDDGGGVLLDYVTQEPTKNIKQAIGPKAIIVKPILGDLNGG